MNLPRDPAAVSGRPEADERVQRVGRDRGCGIAFGKEESGKSCGVAHEGIGLLKKASESAPDDALIRFNYGATLFLSENYIEAAAQLRNAIAVSPRDGDAYYLLAKAL